MAAGGLSLQTNKEGSCQKQPRLQAEQGGGGRTRLRGDSLEVKVSSVTRAPNFFFLPFAHNLFLIILHSLYIHTSELGGTIS